MFGYTSMQMLGRNVSLLMPEPHQTHHDGYLQHFRETGEARMTGVSRDLQGLRQDGTVFPMNLSVSSMTRSGQTTFIGLVRDLKVEMLRTIERNFPGSFGTIDQSRLVLSYEALAEGLTADALIAKVMARLPLPDKPMQHQTA